MIISDITVWVIMSKDRTLIAKGNVRDRHLVPVDDVHDTRRILTYSSKGRATGAFKSSVFWGMNLIIGQYDANDLSTHLEAVEVHMQMVSCDDMVWATSGWRRGVPESGIQVKLPMDYPHVAVYDPSTEQYMVTSDLGTYNISANLFNYWRRA